MQLTVSDGALRDSTPREIALTWGVGETLLTRMYRRYGNTVIDNLIIQTKNIPNRPGHKHNADGFKRLFEYKLETLLTDEEIIEIYPLWGSIFLRHKPTQKAREWGVSPRTLVKAHYNLGTKWVEETIARIESTKNPQYYDRSLGKAVMEAIAAKG